MTGKDGKARVTFKAPTALSAYRITARGVTGADTLAGQTTASLTVRKNFFVDLKVPSSLTQGDKPRFIARVHHTDVVGKLALRLAIYAGGRDEVFPKTVDLKQDGVDEVLFEPFEVPETRLGPADAHRRGRRRDATSWWSRCRSVRGACRWLPPSRAPAARARRLRRPAGGPDLREPRDVDRACRRRSSAC